MQVTSKPEMKTKLYHSQQVCFYTHSTTMECNTSISQNNVFSQGWCHPRKIVDFCENCFCHNLKTNKVKYINATFLEREFHEEYI